MIFHFRLKTDIYFYIRIDSVFQYTIFFFFFYFINQSHQSSINIYHRRGIVMGDFCFKLNLLLNWIQELSSKINFRSTFLSSRITKCLSISITIYIIIEAKKEYRGKEKREIIFRCSFVCKQSNKFRLNNSWRNSFYFVFFV